MVLSSAWKVSSKLFGPIPSGKTVYGKQIHFKGGWHTGEDKEQDMPHWQSVVF